MNTKSDFTKGLKGNYSVYKMDIQNEDSKTITKYSQRERHARIFETAKSGSHGIRIIETYTKRSARRSSS